MQQPHKNPSAERAQRDERDTGVKTPQDLQTKPYGFPNLPTPLNVSCAGGEAEASRARSCLDWRCRPEHLIIIACVKRKVHIYRGWLTASRHQSTLLLFNTLKGPETSCELDPGTGPSCGSSVSQMELIGQSGTDWSKWYLNSP